MTSFARQYLLMTGASPKDVIGGEVADEKFEGQILLTGWDWSLKRNTSEEFTGNASASTSGVRVNAIPDTFGFTKEMDKSSLLMLNRMKAGEKLNATVTLVTSTDTRFSLVIKMKNVRIIDYKMDGDDSDKGGAIKEDWTLNYDEITFEHSAEPPKGGGLKNFTSTHKRPAQASTEKADTKTFVDKFGAFGKSEQGQIAVALKAKYKDNFS